MIATATELEYFVEIHRTRHISKAALRLGVTQPTLTQSLQRLEEKIGAQLFFRTKQGVVPTEQGALFHVRAMALIDLWKSVCDQAKESTTRLQGRFRVGCHPSVGAYSIPLLLSNLNRAARGIEIELIHDISRKITEGIVSYAIDLGYVVNPSRHPDLVLKKIGTDRVTFWKKKNLSHPPKKLLADSNLFQVETLLRKTRGSQFHGWGSIQSSSLELIRTLTLSGQGVGILPERVALADGADLVPYDPRLPSFNDEIYLAYRKEALNSAAGKMLVKQGAISL